MTERAERRLLDLKARQEAGEHMMCPRCGRDAMKAPVHTNALSRTADMQAHREKYARLRRERRTTEEGAQT